jgi:hypothetical protein
MTWDEFCLLSVVSIYILINLCCWVIMLLATLFMIIGASQLCYFRKPVVMFKYAVDLKSVQSCLYYYSLLESLWRFFHNLFYKLNGNL